jgi:hypothetical protein
MAAYFRVLSLDSWGRTKENHGKLRISEPGRISNWVHAIVGIFLIS